MTALQAMKAAVFLKSIACTFPPSAARRRGLASVLDLEQYHLFRSNLRSSHTRDNQTILMLISLYDVKVPIPAELERHPLQDDQTHAVCLMIMQALF